MGSEMCIRDSLNTSAMEKYLAVIADNSSKGIYLEDGTLVVALATGKNLFDKTVSNVKEVKARGAVVMGVTTEEHEHMDDVADYTVKIPATHEMLLPSLTVIPLQLFGYYVASLKGCDIDKPRNLAKSVTVE